MECRIPEGHCEECGRPQGGTYSTCCNELVVSSGECRGFHAEKGA